MNGSIDFLSQMLVQYGLAGIVVYIFYKLISNDLKDVKASIDQLKQSIEKLAERIR
jgi:hypothetical protein